MNSTNTKEPALRSSALAERSRAEREGFEPSVPVYPVRRFSKPLVSATHPPLQAELKYFLTCIRTICISHFTLVKIDNSRVKSGQLYSLKFEERRWTPLQLS